MPSLDEVNDLAEILKEVRTALDEWERTGEQPDVVKMFGFAYAGYDDLWTPAFDGDFNEARKVVTADIEALEKLEGLDGWFQYELGVSEYEPKTEEQRVWREACGNIAEKHGGYNFDMHYVDMVVAGEIAVEDVPYSTACPKCRKD